jgi:hypothetical protein
MKLSHLALTVIEDPDHADAYHWILLETTGHEIDQVREFASSEISFESAQARLMLALRVGGPRC